MMVIYSGELRVFHLSRHWEVFVPASEDEAGRFQDAVIRELPRRLTPLIEILDEVFPRVAEAYRRAGIRPGRRHRHGSRSVRRRAGRRR